MKIFEWFMEPYKFGIQEFKYLHSLFKETDSKKEKARIHKLRMANMMFMAVYSLFLMGMVSAILQAFIYGFMYLIALFFPLIPMLVLRKIQKNTYLKIRDAYVKNNPASMKK